MDNIVLPTAAFDFTTLNLENPQPLQGGSFFTKINFSDKGLPLYVQLPKAASKHGIVRNSSTKKAYIDLLFDYYESELLSWFENLETRCRELIYEKKDIWFHTEMSADDIEGRFISPNKAYKSGKFIMVRTHIPVTRQIKQEGCMIYDESERLLESSVVKECTKIIPLIHVDGIRFSSSSFQLEINVRQIMVLSVEEAIKNDCMIKVIKPKAPEGNTLEVLDNEVSENTQPLDINDKILKEEEINTNTNDSDNKDTAVSDPNEKNIVKTSDTTGQEKEKDKVDEIVMEDSSLGNSADNELQEIDLSVVDETCDGISLKKPNEVYYEIYKAAYEKAKHMKKVAVDAHLEALNIKNKYMLDDIVTSDDEFSNCPENED